MSKDVSKKIDILWKLNVSSFQKVNSKYPIQEPRRVGSSASGVRRMLANNEKQTIVMRTILGLDPTSSTWSSVLKNYWDSLSVDITSGGRTLEVGFRYDVKTTEPIHEKNITLLRKATTVKREDKMVYTITTDDQLATYVEEKVVEGERYKYAFPINVEDYSLYDYCLGYRDVANKQEDADKSERIRFYLYSQEEAAAGKRKLYKSKTKALELYLELTKDEMKVENVLYLLGKGDAVAVLDSQMDKNMLLEEVYRQNIDKFIKVVEDKTLEVKAKVERLVAAGILKRLVGSSIITNAADPSDVVGNDIEEAVVYFSNDKNTAKVSEYISRYKGLLKTDKI